MYSYYLNSNPDLVGKAVQSQYFDDPSSQYQREKSNNYSNNFFKEDGKKHTFILGSQNQHSNLTLYNYPNYDQPLKLNPFSQVDYRKNEEIKAYLKSLDLLLQQSKNIKKETFASPLKSMRDGNSIIEDKMDDMSNNFPLSKSRYLVENEGLKYLEKKYLTNEIKHKLTHSTNLVKKKDHWNFDHNHYQLGELFCINCQEFINPNEVNAHSSICDKEINDSSLGILNDKIENLKLLLIINYKNSLQEDSEEFMEFENFIHIGAVIMDEIFHNNKNLKKLKENFEDLKELYFSMNRLRTKKMNAVKSLVHRMFQAINRKIEIIDAPNRQENNYINNNHSFNHSNFSNNQNAIGKFQIPSSLRTPLREESPLSLIVQKERSRSPAREPVPLKKNLNDYFGEDDQ